jgi:hypothetical protein
MDVGHFTPVCWSAAFNEFIESLLRAPLGIADGENNAVRRVKKDSSSRMVYLDPLTEEGC